MYFLVALAFIAGYWVALFATWNRMFRRESEIRQLSNDIAVMVEMGDPVPLEWVQAQLDYLMVRDR
jgi:hypothetical protein